MSGQRRRARLNDIAKIAEALRDPVETPDFTSSILERVHATKPFAAPETRRWVPVVRIGAVALSLMTVFAMTLIIFVKPDLPEQLGAAPSVTTELVLSAENGVTSRVAELRKGVRALTEVTEPLRLVPLQISLDAPLTQHDDPILAAEAFPTASPRPQPVSEPSDIASATVVLPLPAPMAVRLPQPATYSWRDASMAASFASADAAYPSMDTAYGVGSGYRAAPAGSFHRTTLVSQYKTTLASYIPPMTSPKPHPVKPASPTLVKELVNLITGQPAGDEHVIR